MTIRAVCLTCGEQLQATATCHLCGGRAFIHVVDGVARNLPRVTGCRAVRCAGGHVIGQGQAA